MDIFKKLGQLPNQLLYDAGQRSYAEYFVKGLSEQDQPVARKFFKELAVTGESADPLVYFQKMAEFKNFLSDAQQRTQFAEINKTYLFRGNTDFFGYRPSGSKLWNYFPNPFGAFAYCAEQYWAVGRCMELIRETMEADGFALKGMDGVSDAKLTEYYKRLNSLDLDKLWVEKSVHEALFGNFFMLKHTGSRSRTLTQLEILYPPRLVPIFDANTAEIIQYEYNVGRYNRYYTPDEVVKFGLEGYFGREIGTPPLLGSVIEIETALMAMNMNNNFLQKGAMLGKLISLKPPTDDNSMSQSTNSEWVRSVQNQMDFIHSGTKAGGGWAVLSGVDNVYDITKQGEIELGFQNSRDALDKRIAQRIGIPSEKIGIARSASVQYQPSLVENVVNAQFDATINAYGIRNAKYFNREILQKELGIYDARLVPAGRYGALTLDAAKVITELANAGPITTVNEARVKILGWEPLPSSDPRGNMTLDVLGRDPESASAVLAPDLIDPRDNVDKILGNSGNVIKIGGLNSGEIYRHNSKFF